MIVAIDKPKGPTSHDMIYKVRKVTHEKKVGHAGTLDPMASGVLVIAIGRNSTKRLSEIMSHDKEYEAIITLGAYSDTDDAQGLITPVEPSSYDRLMISEEVITGVIGEYVGEISQIPPAYSALKMNGKKAYELARAGKIPKMEARTVRIYKIELLKYSWPEISLRVHCDKGVYIRSLARDIGQRIGTGGYLSFLKRTRVGNYRINDTLTLDEVGLKWSEFKTNLDVKSD